MQILSAQYANDEATAAVVTTDDAGDVVLSILDTPEEWAELLAWGEPSAYVAAPVPARRIAKLTLISRLTTKGKLGSAFAALGGPGAEKYERWSASRTVDTSNADVRGLLAAIGLDVEELLAPETADEINA